VKISQRTTPTRATAALAVGLMAIPATMAASHPAASHRAPSPTASTSPTASPTAKASRTPGLTITVSDGHVAARAGDGLTYLVSVRNTGAVAVPRLKVTQTLSAGLKFLSASGHGVATSGHVSWSASLPVGGERTFRVATRVTRTPTTQLRLAAVACVVLPDSSRPLVCASHLDRLPAAVAQPAARSGRSVGNVLMYTAAALAVLALALVAAIIVRRRGRPRRHPA
jgi:uncharacterized repeat protein (TIGR01451 family)